jgi:asparagine synthase (glutamine-hydrolysing)
MVSDNGTFGLVFNGEIYNYKAVRAELARRGAPFRTNSDTEVLLRAAECDWHESVHTLRGMFAFAAWDDTGGRLLLARDRLGKKPLYYVVERGVLYFASSLSTLRDTASKPYDFDVQAIDRYLTLGYIPAPGTVYRDVCKLAAGTRLVLDGGAVRVDQFWDLAAADPPFEGSFEDAVDHTDALLQDAVALRLQSDVPLGVFLSGGIDSSLVAAVAARQSPERIHTFSIGMDESEFDESGYAAEVAAHLGTEHRLFRVTPDLLTALPEMVWHYGEPFADSSALPTWLLSQQTRSFVTVALGGDGGDEGFAGYEWYRTAHQLRRTARGIPEPAFALAGSALGGLMRTGIPLPHGAARARRGLRMLGTPHGARRFAAMRSLFGPDEAQRLYAGALAAERTQRGDTASALLTALYEQAGGTELRRMRYVDVRSYLADCLLPKVDVASMAHSLEVRAPLLDQEIVRFALTLPDAYVSGPDGGKRVLRALLSRYVPRALFERPKRGFTLPLKRWLAGPAFHAVESLTQSPALMDTGWFRPDGIREMVRQHVANERDHSERLYSLLALNAWLARR